MNKIGITYHPKSEAARRCAEETRALLDPKPLDVWLASAWDDGAREEHVPGTDLLICCGGDGSVRLSWQSWPAFKRSRRHGSPTWQPGSSGG